MPAGVRLHGIKFSVVPVTERTQWIFATVTDSDGLSEVVEITSGNDPARVTESISTMLSRIRDQTLMEESHLPDLLGLTLDQLKKDRLLATAVSGLRTALAGLQAQHQGLSLTVALGGKTREKIPLYANINRSLLGNSRTPEHFAAAAARAVQDGFSRIKCAPFDEVSPPASTEDIRTIAALGLQRVSAIRDRIGPNVELMVDCHSRFELHTAPVVAEALAKLAIGWFEEPVSPTENSPEMAQITRQVAMPTAGGEAGYGVDFFTDLIESGAVNIIMPDTKFCGGVAEATRCGQAALRLGANVSFHSPSGPVSQLASAHATAALDGAMPLEHAVNEASWRQELLVPPERIEQGYLWFPGGPGSGAVLNQQVIQSRGQQWEG